MSDAENALQRIIVKLAHHEEISADEATAAFDDVMRGNATSTQLAALLTGLRVRGETAEIVAGVARALRNAMIHLSAKNSHELVDTCGTGGGSVQTFNISTAAALLAAGAGIRIAKHGNRSFTSKCGSADVLQALGVAIEVPVATMEKALDQAGIVFMFAPLMHPAMKYVGPVRRELAIPTVMNVVGPLANPASAQRQVVGVADLVRAPILAAALAQLGTTHTMVVHGEPGLDEVSPMGPTHVWEVQAGKVKEWSVTPEEFGFKPATAEELAGGTPDENARIIEKILRGEGSSGAAAAVIMNAAAAIYVSGRNLSMKKSAELAAAALKSGAGLLALEKLRAAYS